jgi:DNA repair exonuclease SbcCD ATPase subunit
MRGEESWVSKCKDGFKVNGQAVESLSGSTLDILGLAIRCALIRTFLPQCSLLILDEPAAAMDERRTESLLGFISGSGFNQVLLITHEEISESVASNVIEV